MASGPKGDGASGREPSELEPQGCHVAASGAVQAPHQLLGIGHSGILGVRPVFAVEQVHAIDADAELVVDPEVQVGVGNFKLNHELATNLQFDASARITNTIVNGAGTSGSSQIRIKDAIATRPVNGIADELDIDLNSIQNDDEYQSFLLNLIDPTELAEQDWRKRTTNNYVFNGALTWTALKNLNLKTTFTTSTTYDDRLRYYGPLTGESKQEGSSLPLGTMDENQRYSYRWQNTAHYIFSDMGRHELDILAGQEIYSSGGKGSFVRAENFRVSMGPEEMFANMTLGNTVQQSTSQSTANNLFSYLGRVNYQFDNKYLLTATFRADASSKFSKSNRWGFFPAVAVGWKLSEENFMTGVGFVDELK